MTAGILSEDTLIEQPTIALLGALGWSTLNCFEEAPATLGREATAEVVLRPRLLAALQALNPALPPQALPLAIAELTRDRSLMLPVQANRVIHQLLKNGVKVSFASAKGEQTTETVRVIDWQNPENNDFLLASQLWVTGEMYKRRCDLVGFVNGLPLVFIELKASQKRSRTPSTTTSRTTRAPSPNSSGTTPSSSSATAARAASAA